MKNFCKALGSFGIIATGIILITIGWYLSTIFCNNLICFVCIIIVSAASGHMLAVNQRHDKEERENSICRLITCIESNHAEQIDFSKQAADLLARDVQSLSEQIHILISSVSNLDDLITTSEKHLSALLNDDIVALSNTMESAAHEQSTHLEQLQAKANNIYNAISINENARQDSARRIISTLNSTAESVSKVHQEIKLRMAALEQQNTHLQMLTTMIGTVRSDIATINEVKGFTAEVNAGRKVRIARDDEHRIVVESLMNSDGTRIEKSKMYREGQLAFEAEFDAVGRMTLSRSYGNSGSSNTEVYYTVQNSNQVPRRKWFSRKHNP